MTREFNGNDFMTTCGVHMLLYICADLAVFFLTPFSVHFFSSEPPKVTSMRLDERTSTSLSVSWMVASRRAQPRPIQYELIYRKKVRPSAQQQSSPKIPRQGLRRPDLTSS